MNNRLQGARRIVLAFFRLTGRIWILDSFGEEGKGYWALSFNIIRSSDFNWSHITFVRAKLYNLGSDYFEWFLCLWNDHEDRDECCIDWIRISNSSISTYIGGLIYFAARPITHKATFTDRHVSILLGATLFYTSITHCNDGYISRD